MSNLLTTFSKSIAVRFCLPFALACSLTPGNIYAQDVAPFKNGDRVVFVGNSITDGGHYHSFIWLYYMTRFPGMRITCLNAGIGGDVAKQISRRFDDDVLAKKPTVLTLSWGMNDTGYMEWWKSDAQETFKNRLDTSLKYYHIIEGKLKSHPEIKKIIIASSPYDETTTSAPQNLYKGKSAALLQIATFQEQAAKAHNWSFVDFNRPMTAINQKGQATNPAFSLTPNDRIHPDNDGHMVMAYLFLKKQGLAGKPVANVQIDAAAKRVVKAENASISALNNTGNEVSFQYLAKALPYPLDTVVRGWGSHRRQSEALQVVPFNKEFNQEVLSVKGLAEGTYQLIIDNEAIGEWSSSAFAEGINLAEQTNTPQYQQALQILVLNEERWEIERRFRNHAFIDYNVLYDRGLHNADNRVAMDTVNAVAKREIFVNGNKQTYLASRFKTVRDAWQSEMNLLVDEIYKINKPVGHKVTLKKIK